MISVDLRSPVILASLATPLDYLLRPQYETRAEVADKDGEPSQQHHSLPQGDAGTPRLVAREPQEITRCEHLNATRSVELEAPCSSRGAGSANKPQGSPSPSGANLAEADPDECSQGVRRRAF